ncbi:hypothetical protein AGDE_14811 [Angomonas deanei]|nr:hypothetical protein AGDE_14811 [Angomonas deanei]|eukprot:EPY20174.1 hypothetical protein AGDE_14811 [Angomonas deanei]
MDAALASEVRYGQTVLSTLQLAPVAVEGGGKESGEQYHCYATNTRENMVMFPFTMPVFSDGILIDLSAHMVQTSLDGRNGERRGMDAKALLGKGCLMTREEKAQKLEHALKLIESASFLQL